MRAIEEYSEKRDDCHLLGLFVDTLAHRCGYLGVPKTHPWYKKHYIKDKIEEILDDCHRGLTWSGFLKGRGEDYWYFGFDCAHLYDAPDKEAYLEYFGEEFSSGIPHDIYDEVRDLQFVKDNIHNLWEQLVEWETHEWN